MTGIIAYRTVAIIIQGMILGSDRKAVEHGAILIITKPAMLKRIQLTYFQSPSAFATHISVLRTGFSVMRMAYFTYGRFRFCRLAAGMGSCFLFAAAVPLALPLMAAVVHLCPFAEVVAQGLDDRSVYRPARIIHILIASAAQITMSFIFETGFRTGGGFVNSVQTG